MLQGGFLPHHLTRVDTLAPCQQLILQRSTHHLARFKDCPVAWFPVALSRTNRLVLKAAVLHPLLRHRRLLGFGPPPHAAHYRPQPSARLIRQQLLDLDILPYKERHVKVTTCGDLYKKWRAEGRRGYEQAPETGAHVPVVYIHTGMDRVEQGDRTERPLTLMFTGAPGHYGDYGKTIPFLDQNGVDVLCFNWPDFGFTLETGYWWHSCDEKTRIDMLVSHSLGSAPALQLVAEDPSIDVKSLALLTPITTRHFRGSRNLLLFNPAVRWATMSRLGARVMIFFFKAVTMLSMHPTMGRPHDAFFAYHSSVGHDEHRVELQLRTIRHRKVPTLVILGDNDRLLSKKDNRKLLRRLGCESEGACLYDADGNLLRSGSCDDVVKAIELKDGSHHGFARCPDICNKALLELINGVQER